MRTHDWDVGEVIHGFAGGAFGRDSYRCRRVEAVGHDWIVARNEFGQTEFASGNRIPTHADAAQDKENCVYFMCDMKDGSEPDHPPPPPSPWS